MVIFWRIIFHIDSISPMFLPFSRLLVCRLSVVSHYLKDMHLICISKWMTVSINSIFQACVESFTLIVIRFWNVRIIFVSLCVWGVFFSFHSSNSNHFSLLHLLFSLKWKNFRFHKMPEKKRQFNRASMPTNWQLVYMGLLPLLLPLLLLFLYSMFKERFIRRQCCMRWNIVYMKPFDLIPWNYCYHVDLFGNIRNRCVYCRLIHRKPFNLRAPDILLFLCCAVQNWRKKQRNITLNHSYEQHAERHSPNSVRHSVFFFSIYFTWHVMRVTVTVDKCEQNQPIGMTKFHILVLYLVWCTMYAVQSASYD